MHCSHVSDARHTKAVAKVEELLNCPIVATKMIPFAHSHAQVKLRVLLCQQRGHHVVDLVGMRHNVARQLNKTQRQALYEHDNFVASRLNALAMASFI